MNYFLKLFVFFIIFCTQAYANYNYSADIFKQIIQNPSISSCSIGNDVRSAEATYQKQDIVGMLPYIRRYSTALDDSLMLSNDIYDGSVSIGGWKDNYFNYLVIHDFGPSNTNRFRIQVLLPEEQLQTYYSADINNGSVSTIKRINSPAPDMYYAVARNGSSDAYKYFGTAGELNTNHRGKSLVISRNKKNISNTKNVSNAEGLQFVVYHQGSAYVFENIYRGGYDKDTAIYKATRIVKPNGQVLSLKYSTNNGALQRVVDQYGNFLDIRYSILDADIDPVQYSYPSEIYAGRFSRTVYDPLNEPVDINNTQKATYSYSSYLWNNYNKNNRLENIYVINSVTSTNFGKEDYSYTQVAQVSSQININGRMDGRWTQPYRVPALVSVKDALGRTLRTFNYNNAAAGTNWYSNLSIVSGPGDLWKTERNFNGGSFDESSGNWYKSYSLNFYTAGNRDQDFNAVNIKLYGKHKNNIVYMDVSGFPCLTYNKTPISFMEYDVVNDTINYIIDRNNIKTHFIYDDQGRLASKIEAEGTLLQRVKKYTYSTDIENYLVPIKIESPLQIVNNTLQYGRVIKTVISYPYSSKTQTISYSYTSDGLLRSITYPDGASRDYTYTTFGGLLASERFSKLNQSLLTEYSDYNSAGEPKNKTVKNWNNHISKVVTSYDVYNRPTEVRDYDINSSTSRVTRYSYDQSGLVLTETDEDGLITKYSYNAASLVDKKTVGTLVNNYVYNANGQLISVDQNDGITTKRLTTHLYDRNGQTFESRIGNSADQMWTRYEYDSNGNTTKILNPTSNNTIANVLQRFDALNRLSGFTDELGKDYNYSYDTLDNITLQKAPNLFNSTNKYINGKELDTEKNTDFGSKQYTYDDISNPLTSLHAGFRLCTFSGYDLFNNFNSLICQNKNLNVSNYDVKYAFNYNTSRLGQLDSVLSTHNNSLNAPAYWGANTYYLYDGYNRLINKEQRVGIIQTATTTRKLTVGYSYTNGNRLKSITYPSGKVIQYDYDFSKSGNISGVKLNSATLVGVSYQQDLISGLNWGNGSISNYQYDEFGRLLNIINLINNGVYRNIGYNYYPNGLIQTKNIEGVNFGYSYDDKGQLFFESKDNGYVNNFVYDENGNRKVFINLFNFYNSNQYPFRVVGTTYADNTNKISSIGYDDNKFLTLSHNSTGELQLTDLLGNANYDYMGRRLWQSASPSGKYVSHTMQYNHKNERVYSGLTGDLARQYIYDEAGHLLGEYNVNGVPYVEYIWLGDKPIAALYPDRTVYLLTDHINTPVWGIDAATKAVVWEWTPDAFGVAKPSIQTVKMNLRFAGQYYDETTGLHYNMNRYYNPMLGRYMEPDPIGLKGGWNPYAYAGNDPVNHTDASGLIVDTIVDAGLAGHSIYSAYKEPTLLNIAAATYDTLAVAIPFVPAGAGLAISTTSKAEKLVRVRHFTNTKGLNGIQESKVIRASDQNKVFTIKASGKPGSPRDVEKALGIKNGHGRNYIEFDAYRNEFETIKNARTGATEITFKGNVDLINRNPEFFKR